MLHYTHFLFLNKNYKFISVAAHIKREQNIIIKQCELEYIATIYNCVIHKLQFNMKTKWGLK